MVHERNFVRHERRFAVRGRRFVAHKVAKKFSIMDTLAEKKEEVDPFNISEEEFKAQLISDLQTFLLDLGKGFTFVARDFQTDPTCADCRVDLVLYHRILRTFILIDLNTTGAVQRSDVERMNRCMSYFANHESHTSDDPPLGVILSKENDKLLVELASYGLKIQDVRAKYEPYMPDKEELQRLIIKWRSNFDLPR